ncbi:MAG TPA: hypothetical protein VIM62_07195 [Acidobacteriaceae bacterium]
MLWLAQPPDFSHGVRRMVGAMAGEKEEKQGSGVKTVTGLETEVQEGELSGPDRCCEEANRQLWTGFSEIIQGFMDRAKKGDPVALKTLFEMADRVRRKEPISKEEMETLGQMLMREFRGMPEEENGGLEAKVAQQGAA